MALAITTVRRQTARLRLWMWRVAALKFVIPFWLLFACGEWLGFPVDRPGDLPPAAFIAAVRTAPPAVSPATTAGLSGYPLAAGMGAMLLAAFTCLRVIVAGVQLEAGRARAEALRLERDPDDIEPSPGLIHAACLTALCVLVVTVPVLAGATRDRVRRHGLLMANAKVLRLARAEMQIAASGMGNRPRVIAHPHGVLIRNANVQDLVAIAYGVDQLSVWYTQMFYEDTAPEIKYWVYWPRYDVRIAAPIQAPAEFDSYALRQIVTKLLAERFGLEVYVQRECQPPCGVYNVPLPPVE
jgi:hypothetical protein